MAFATVLVMNGYNPIMEKVTADSLVWVVSSDEYDEDLEALQIEYLSGACRVEPRRFIREVGDIRKGMYRFLNVASKDRGARVRRAPSA